MLLSELLDAKSVDAYFREDFVGVFAHEWRTTLDTAQRLGQLHGDACDGDRPVQARALYFHDHRARDEMRIGNDLGYVADWIERDAAAQNRCWPFADR